MSIPQLYIRRGRAWVVALLLVVFALGVVGFVPEHERNASPTDSLPAGYDSTKVVELAGRFSDDGTSAAIVLYTAQTGTLTNDQLAAARASLLKRLPATAMPAAPSGGAPVTASGPPAGVTADRTGGMPPLPIVSEDRTAALGTIPVNADLTSEENAGLLSTLRSELSAEAPAGVTVQVTGPAAIRADLGAVFKGANFRLLAATAAVVALLLLLTYRSPVLWIIPLTVVGLADRLAAVAATHTLAFFGIPWDESTVGILSVLVFGAGTNYALLLISRYRDELRAVPDRYEAMARALRHAGEAVITSASTVVLGVLTLLISVFPATRGLGLASAVGIVIAAGYALVVLPSVLVLFGRWVFWPLIPRVGDASLADSRRSIWARVGDLVARKPSALIAGSLILLTVMGLGITRVQTGLSPSDQFLQKPEAIAALDRLGESFPAGASDPLVVITEGDGAAVAEIAKDVRGVSSATIGSKAEGLTQVKVVLQPEPGSEEARQAVRDLRAALVDTANTWVGGTEAKAVDARDGAAADQRLVIPLILALVISVLVLLLRSIVAPLILVTTVVGTYAAALGTSWVIFAEVLGFARLDSSAPLITFLFLVALGVDYNIFLVTRAREESLRQGSRLGMRRALTATGGVITSAGILLAAVFGVLGVLPLVVLAQIGVIIGVGVLLDTLLVRTVLVPAIALALGDAFWWPRRPAVARRAVSDEAQRTSREEKPVGVR